MVPSYRLISNDAADVYRTVFGHGPGAMIIKGCFDDTSMQRLATLLENEASGQPQYVNGKRVLPSAMEYISEIDPVLALTIISNAKLNTVLHAVLGHAHIASWTGHTLIHAACQKQMHTDYPDHIYSGKFGRNYPEKFRQPHAIHALIAPVKIGHSNGGTLLVEASHRVPDIDLIVHEPVWQGQRVGCRMLVCPELAPGDVLLFNREIAHCGCGVPTGKVKAALIGQCGKVK